MIPSITDAAKPSSSTPSLTVREVKDLVSLQQLAKKWHSTASTRFRAADRAQYTDAPLCDQRTLDHLEASKMMTKAICNKIREAFLKQGESDYFDKALVCTDQDSKIQAIALIRTKENRVAFVATHPDNIPSTLTDPAKRVRGAGTQIILHLAKRTLKTGKPVLIDTLDSASDFYAKLGFTQAGLMPELHLTASKINLLISEKVPPFNQLGTK